MFGDLSMQSKRIRLLGDGQDIKDAANLLYVQQIGRVTTTSSTPIFTSNTTGSWGCSVSSSSPPVPDPAGLYRIFDQNPATSWSATASTYTITIQNAGAAVLTDQLRIQKTGNMTNFRVRIGSSSVSTQVAYIDTVDDDGFFQFSQTYSMTSAVITFATGGCVINEVSFTRGRVDIGKELTCHDGTSPSSVPTRSYIDNLFTSLTSYISPSYVLPMFTDSITDGNTSLASDQLPSNPGWFALDRKASTSWICTGAVGSTTLDVTLTAPKTITAVQILGRLDDANFDFWEIQGYDEDISAYVTLLSITSSPTTTLKSYLLTTPDAYTTYRFVGTNSSQKTSAGLSILNYTYSAIECNSNRLSNISDGTNQSDATSLRQLQAVSNSKLSLSGGLMTGNLYFESGLRSVVIDDTPSKFDFPLSVYQTVKQLALYMGNSIANRYPRAFLILECNTAETTPTDPTVAVSFTPASGSGNMLPSRGDPSWLEFSLTETDLVTILGASTDEPSYAIQVLLLVTNDGFDPSSSLTHTVSVVFGNGFIYNDQFSFEPGSNYHLTSFYIGFAFTTTTTCQLLLKPGGTSGGGNGGLKVLCGSMAFCSSESTPSINTLAVETMTKEMGKSYLTGSILAQTISTYAGIIPHAPLECLAINVLSTGSNVSWNATDRRIGCLYSLSNSLWKLNIIATFKNETDIAAIITIQIVNASANAVIAVVTLPAINRRINPSTPSLTERSHTHVFEPIKAGGNLPTNVYIRMYCSNSIVSLEGGSIVITRLASL